MGRAEPNSSDIALRTAFRGSSPGSNFSPSGYPRRRTVPSASFCCCSIKICKLATGTDPVVGQTVVCLHWYDEHSVRGPALQYARHSVMHKCHAIELHCKTQCTLQRSASCTRCHVQLSYRNERCNLATADNPLVCCSDTL